MRGHKEVLHYLNEALKSELTAIHQYTLHSRMCKNWGYDRLADYILKQAIDEMRHAESLMDRILFLEGTPTVGELLQLRIGKNVKQILQNDLAAEYEAVKLYNEAIEKCVQHGDNGSRELFKALLMNEEYHVDWLETQLHMIEEIGIENYLTEQMKNGEEEAHLHGPESK